MASIASAIGLGLSYYTLADGRYFGASQWGPWVTRADVGAPEPDPYTRAFLSSVTALQLGRTEGVQFIAVVDGNDEPIVANCNYHVSGQTPVAAFWTLRATDYDGTNLASPDGAPASFNSKRVTRDNQGVASINIGPALAPGNWLEISGGDEIQLILTFYDASFLAGTTSEVSNLPTITKVGCI